MNRCKINFYNEKEELLLSFIEDNADIDTLYENIIKTYECDNSIPYKFINNEVYGFIKYFNCYGRFSIYQL